tara:strand:+ start:171 stop:272 length:102 start_codon:yes stop_codon:yes gene_type:complete
MKRKIVPKEMIPSTITFRPPNHTRRPIAIDEEN